MRGERKREAKRKSVILRKLWKIREKDEQKVLRNICMKKERKKNIYLRKRKVKE